MITRRALCMAVAAAPFAAATSPVLADDYPSRPIRVISPFPAGSASDTVGRVVLDQVSQILGQAMVVEAKPGAGGIVGFADVAKADPDGYTVVTSSTSMGTGAVLHSKLPYDPGQGLCFGRHVRRAAERAGRLETERLQDRCRSCRCGKGKTRNADLCLRRCRLILAYGGRAVAACRQDRRAARAFQGQRSHRSDGRTHRLLFHSAWLRRRRRSRAATSRCLP